MTFEKLNLRDKIRIITTRLLCIVAYTIGLVWLVFSNTVNLILGAIAPNLDSSKLETVIRMCGVWGIYIAVTLFCTGLIVGIIAGLYSIYRLCRGRYVYAIIKDQRILVIPTSIDTIKWDYFK